MRDYDTPCLDDVDHDDTPCLDTSFHDHEMDIGEPSASQMRELQRPLTGDIPSGEALQIAHNAIKTTNPDAAKTIQMIIDQRGCEHFDPACDGHLVDLIDIIVFG